jgi:hydrogenase expression/formation protein HypC
MCLAVPSKVISVNEMIATIDVHGARREISLMLLPDEVKEGEYVIVHAGFAIQKLDREAGEDALRLILELVESEEFQKEYM